MTVDPNIIEAGQTAVLKWQTSNADSTSLEPGFGIVVPNGSQTVSPNQSTTYTLKANRGDQEVTSTATLSVTAAPLPPSVSIGVVPMAIASGERATLSWQSSNADYVTIEPGIGNVNATGSISVSPTETTTYFIKAVKDQDQVSAQATLQVEALPTGPYISLDDIDGQAANGANVSRSYVTISGNIHGELGPEIGVTVNGGLAEVNGQHFIMNHLPLNEGWNTIDVIAVDASGLSAESSIDVFASKPAFTIVLIADRYNGVAPFENVLTIYLDPEPIVTNANVDCVGGSPVTVSPITTLEYEATFTSTGLYECQVTITDNNGQTHHNRVGIQVWDSGQLDHALQAKWSAMKEALLNSDQETALSFFAKANRDVFRNQFAVLEPAMDGFVAKMGAFNLVEFKESQAIYDLRVMRDGRELSFQTTFVKDEDGIWLIWAF